METVNHKLNFVIKYLIEMAHINQKRIVRRVENIKRAHHVELLKP